MKRHTFFDDPAHVFTTPWDWRGTELARPDQPNDTVTHPATTDALERNWDEAKMARVAQFQRDALNVH